jgi:hypothetical protein
VNAGPGTSGELDTEPDSTIIFLKVSNSLLLGPIELQRQVASFGGIELCLETVGKSEDRKFLRSG